MKPINSDVYQQLIKIGFVQGYIKEYEGVCHFTPERLKVEIWDDFGQCAVWLGFDDQFAICDAFGNWREASAEECLMLRDGTLPGSMSLVN